jgi:hypothetical protein
MSAHPKNHFTPLENFIERHPAGLPSGYWDMTNLSMNSSITPEFVESHPKGLLVEPGVLGEWDMYFFSMNTSITPEFVENHPNLKWNVYNLSMNPSITSEFVESHPNWNWDMVGFCLVIRP